MKEFISNNKVEGDSSGFRVDKNQMRRARLVKESEYNFPDMTIQNRTQSRTISFQRTIYTIKTNYWR